MLSDIITMSIDDSQILMNVAPKDKEGNVKPLSSLSSPTVTSSNPNLIDAAFQGEYLRLNRPAYGGVGSVVVRIAEGYEGGYAEEWTVNVVAGKTAKIDLSIFATNGS